MTASLLNLGENDLIVLLLIALLLFGAKKLPELARGLGEAVDEFCKAKDEFERELGAAEPVQHAAPISWKTLIIVLAAALLLAALLYFSP